MKINWKRDENYTTEKGANKKREKSIFFIANGLYVGAARTVCVACVVSFRKQQRDTHTSKKVHKNELKKGSTKSQAF